MMTFLAPPAICPPARSASVKMPVDSTHDVRAKLAPRQLGRIALGENRNLVAVNDDAVVGSLYGSRVSAVGGVVLEQPRVVGGLAQIVHRDDFQRIGMPLAHSAKNLSADASKPVDADASSHWGIPPMGES